jgi:hypothetical protein
LCKREKKEKGRKNKPSNAGRSKKKIIAKSASLCGNSKKEGCKNKTVLGSAVKRKKEKGVQKISRLFIPHFAGL